MTDNRTRLYGGAAAAILVAAAAGFGLARLTAPKPHEAAATTARTANALTLTASAVQAAGIGVAPVQSGGLSSEILAQGSVRATPSGEAVLTARAAGAVTRIFKRLGDPVRAGETLAVVESRDAAQIAADRAAAAAKANLAQHTLAREKSLYEQRVSPRMDYEQAQAEAASASAELRRTQAAAGAAQVTADGRGVLVTSPIAGRVTTSTVSLGAFVQPETELFRIADPNRIQVEASVTGEDAARIAPGDRAQVETSDGRVIQALARSVTPSLNQETRTATVVIDAPGLGLQPGQAVRVRLFPRAAPTGTAIVLPEDAIQSVEGRDVVFVRTAQGFKVQPVTVGQRSAGRAEIVAGLQPGQQVAVRNAFLLKAELGKGAGEEE